MEKPKYCVGCDEAVTIKTVIETILEFKTGYSGNIEWKNASFGVCLNEECPRYALLSMLVANEKKGKE